MAIVRRLARRSVQGQGGRASASVFDRQGRRPRRFTRWSSRVVLASPPSSMARGGGAVCVTARSARERAEGQGGEVEAASSAVLPEPEWESLRKAIFEAGGALAVNAEGMRFILDQSQRNRLEKLNGEIQQLNASDPASPARAMVMNDAAQPMTRTCSCGEIRGGRGRRFRGGS